MLEWFGRRQTIALPINFGRWLPDCNHSADDFIGEQRKNAMVRLDTIVSDLGQHRAHLGAWTGER